VRAIGTVVLAPFAEKVAFRGWLRTRLSRTRLGGAGAAAVTAALFTALHSATEPTAVAQIFSDGMFFGVARFRTGSVLLPIVMHCLGNFVATLERLLA
jgi:hypothetical protein